MNEIMVDALREGQIVTIPLSEARAEGLFVLKKHEAKQEADVAPVVPFSKRRDEYERRDVLRSQVSKWHSYQPEYKKNHVMGELIDNFHWGISKARRLKNFSRAQLAKAVGVPEYHIKMLENGELPSDDFILITKIEHILGIKLRRSYPASSQAPVRGLVIRSEEMKPHYSESTSLSDLQRRKELEKKQQHEKLSKDVSGSDIEIIE